MSGTITGNINGLEYLVRLVELLSWRRIRCASDGADDNGVWVWCCSVNASLLRVAALFAGKIAERVREFHDVSGTMQERAI